MPAPIALFVYNRLHHTKETVEALRNNTLAKDSDLFIFSDGPRNRDDARKVIALRKYLRTIGGFRSCSVITREQNIGLASSIINGVTDLLKRFGTIVVVEDDLVTSRYFLSYLNQGLRIYEHHEQVVCIHGYVYPARMTLPETFFVRGADCWGWATWSRGWRVFESDGQKLLDALQERGLNKDFNLDDSIDYVGMLRSQIAGENDSWAIRWHASAYLAGKMTLYPGQSLVNNIGFDGSGTHAGDRPDMFSVNMSNRDIRLEAIPVQESTVGRNAFVQHFRNIRPGRPERESGR
jgi:hypothetical protein